MRDDDAFDKEASLGSEDTGVEETRVEETRVEDTRVEEARVEEEAVDKKEIDEVNAKQDAIEDVLSVPLPQREQPSTTSHRNKKKRRH